VKGANRIAAVNDGKSEVVGARALSVLMESEPGSSFLFAHDLFRKPVPTFRDHALTCGRRGKSMVAARKGSLLLGPHSNRAIDSATIDAQFLAHLDANWI
jgi:hypothetical protein